MGDFFRNMWVGIDAEPAKWGCKSTLDYPYFSSSANAINVVDLGTGHRSIDMDGPNGIKTLNVTYWESIEQLHAYAQSPAHREGWAWWDEYRKKHSDVGIMHETYLSPAGYWETIYENCHPIGLGTW